MIPPETIAEIRRLFFAEHWKIGTIATALDVHPDTVRGADVCYNSYTRLPKGPLPEGYLPVAPELVVEVRSPTDRWLQVIAKVGEYLNAGVTVVCVLDPDPETAHLFYSDQPTRVLTADEDWAVPERFGDFRVPVRRFFE